MLKLYHSPMACSTACRFALVEAGVEHEVAIVKTWSGEQRSPSYLAINPRGKVPALQTDQGVLTEAAAILTYIADLVPEKRLLPPGAFERASALSWLSFLGSSLHPALAGALFAPQGEAGEAQRNTGVERASAVFAAVEAHLEGRPYLLDQFSACDLYLLIFGLWRNAPQLAGALPAYPNIDRLQQSLLSRPALMTIVGEDLQSRAEAA